MNLMAEMPAVDERPVPGAQALTEHAPAHTPAPIEFRLVSWDWARSANSSGNPDAAVTVCSREQGDDLFREAIETARREAFEEGRRAGNGAAQTELEAAADASVAHERARVTELTHQFAVSRDRYFAGVEQEVVKLSLAIAARVLHREAQLDPLLLQGVVHIALEKMADRSGVVLRTSAADTAAWERTFDTLIESERPAISADLSLRPGECILETRMGTVELGIAVQLDEIERGFFDLLNHRPVS
jgi:flagellar assembly protein FliH